MWGVLSRCVGVFRAFGVREFLVRVVDLVVAFDDVVEAGGERESVVAVDQFGRVVPEDVPGAPAVEDLVGLESVGR